MAHLVRILNDAKLKRAYPVTGDELDGIDQSTLRSINGDEGGSWSPTDPIEIAGKGVVVGGPWEMSTAGVTVTTAANKPILFGRGTTGDYFGIDPAHLGASATTFVDFFEYYGIAPYQATWLGSLIPNAPGNRFYTPLPVRSGASAIASVTVDFRVRYAHGAGVPQYLPRMRVIAVDAEGTVTPLRAKDATTDADGFQFVNPVPASGAAWYALGAWQQWTYTCNVALPVDSSLYRYFVEFIEESGTNAWPAATPGADANLYRSATIAYSGLTVFDGRD